MKPIEAIHMLEHARQHLYWLGDYGAAVGSPDFGHWRPDRTSEMKAIRTIDGCLNALFEDVLEISSHR